jgi:hypothetical protein
MEMVNGWLESNGSIPPPSRRNVATISQVPWRIPFIAKVLERDPVNDD